jgi:Methyltransferase FkbM domain
MLRCVCVSRVLLSHSLDVEGAELTVLKTIDFSKVRIEVLIWERDFPSEDQTRNHQIEQLLRDNGMCEPLPTDMIKRSSLFVNNKSSFAAMCTPPPPEP